MKRGPTAYRSLQEFEREELRPQHKAGWSIDDLWQEAKFNPGEDSSLDSGDPQELNFD